jgi:diguanylate cyclase (GGDEF)-like protein
MSSTVAQGVSRQNLLAILESVPTPLAWVSLPEGQIEFVNHAFTVAFGHIDDQCSNVDQWIERHYVSEKDRHRTRKLWQAIADANAAGRSEVDPVEIEIRGADGTVLTVQHRRIFLHDIGIGIATFEDISARRRAEEALHRLAFEDSLTGAGNRRALQARWLDEISSKISDRVNHLAILLVDLDNFKPINDSLGHDVGDETLAAVAERLRDCIRSSDLLFRIGGDEFVILLPGLHTTDQVESLCERIEAAFERPFALKGPEVSLGATIGVSLWPRDGSDLRLLLRRADEALYRTKKTNKGGWDWFEAPSSGRALAPPRTL